MKAMIMPSKKLNILLFVLDTEQYSDFGRMIYVTLLLVIIESQKWTLPHIWVMFFQAVHLLICILMQNS